MMDNSIDRMRRSFRVLVSPLHTLFIAGLCLLIGFRFFAIEPFDFDEALYRRIAEEMKALGHWSPQPLFNGENYNLTPPTFVGALAFVSWILDGTEAQISSFSARFLGLLCTALSVFFVHRTWIILSRRKEISVFENKRQIRSGISPIYFFLMCFLPTLAAAAIVPEILLSLFTTLFVCAESLRIHNRIKSRQSTFLLYLISVGALFGATVTSGLSGIILSVASAFLFSIWSTDSSRQKLRTLGLFLPRILLALVFSLLFFEWLKVNGGKSFVDQFWDQMLLERASVPSWSNFSEHYWGFPLMLSSSALLLTWLSVARLVCPPGPAVAMEPIRNQKQSEKDFRSKYVLQDERQRIDELTSVRRWLLSWSVVCCLYFAFSTGWRQSVGWSLCPILALFASLGFSERSSALGERARGLLSWSAKFLPFVLPTSFLLIGSVILCWEPVFSQWVTLSPRQSALMSAYLDQKVLLFAGFFGASACLFIAALLLAFWRIRCGSRGYISQIFSLGIARWLAFFQTAAVAIIVLLVLPVAEDMVSITVQQSTAKARMFLGVGAKLATADLYSPTVVSSQREKVILGEPESASIFMDPKISVVLTPVWNLEVCRRHGFDIAQAVEYLRVCLRSYKQTLEGRPP